MRTRAGRATFRRRRLVALSGLAVAVLVAGVVINRWGRGDTATTAGRSPDDRATTTSSVQVKGPDQATLDSIVVSFKAVAKVEHPSGVAQRRGSDDLYVTSVEGKLVLAAADGNQTELADLAGRISRQGESGLLDLAFDATGTFLYLSMVDRTNALVVVEVPMSVGRPAFDRERTIISIEGPTTVHHGGDVWVDPAGLLWLSVGDGGPSESRSDRAQNLGVLHGKILRIDPRGGTAAAPYRVPAGNPFVGRAGARPEIWAYGLRNPWRFNVDTATGDLWVGDVGRYAAEEIDLAPGPDGGRGANFGWPHFEGNTAAVGNAPQGLTKPVLTYGHGDRCAVTGGVVYRGSAIAGLRGAYLFSDLCDGLVRAVVADSGRVVAQRVFASLHAGYPVSLSVDAQGEIYVCSFDEGTVYKIVSAVA